MDMVQSVYEYIEAHRQEELDLLIELAQICSTLILLSFDLD